MQPFQCGFCGKKYSKEGFYKRHELNCEIKNLTEGKKREDEDHVSFTPNETTIIIKKLLEKINNLENEMKNMKVWIDKQKRKCNIFDWLEKSYKPSSNLNDWVNNFKFNNSHLNLVLKYNYIEGMTLIFQKLFPIEESKDFPIKCFDQKNNIFFKYENDKWTCLQPKEFDNIVFKIQKALIKMLKDWELKNKHIVNDERKNEIYFQNIKKVMGGNLEELTTRRRLVNGIYEYLKFNLKEIVEYDFVF